MFCPQCGKENQPQARFCHHCGTALPVAGAAPATQEVPGAQAVSANAAASADPAASASSAGAATPAGPAGSAGSVASAGSAGPAAAPQVTRAQATATDAAPASDQAHAAAQAPAPADAAKGDVAEQVKQARGRTRRKIPVVMLVILVALACASAAFAAHYVYTHFIAPTVVQQEQPTAEKKQQKTEPEDPDKAQKAVFNEVLSAYQSAQANGWPETSFDGELSTISEHMSGRIGARGGAGVFPYYYSQNEELKYAYADFNSDGKLDLLIASIDSEGLHPLVIYVNNGGTARVVDLVHEWHFVYPTLYKSGEISTGIHGNSGYMTYGHLESDGTWTEDASLTNEQLLTGQSTIGDLGEPYTVDDFSWTSLADFTEIK